VAQDCLTGKNEALSSSPRTAQKRKKCAGVVSQEVGYLLFKHEAPNPTKKKKVRIARYFGLFLLLLLYPMFSCI
jgi:hypothetical protein